MFRERGGALLVWGRICGPRQASSTLFSLFSSTWFPPIPFLFPLPHFLPSLVPSEHLSPTCPLSLGTPEQLLSDALNRVGDQAAVLASGCVWGGSY